MRRLLTLFALAFCTTALMAVVPFRFAQLTDIHLSPNNEAPLEDLRRSIDDINAQSDIAFVVVAGDITEAGDRATLELAKQELKRLRVPFYATSGNHETTWSESGCTAFSQVFGSDHFSFTFNDVFFFGLNSGPVLKMADGHIAPQDIIWAKRLLNQQPNGTPVICVTHYPLQNGDVDNWYSLTDLLRQYNTLCVIGGHYHRNLLFSADGIPDVLCRSNLREKEGVNGYTLVSVTRDSILFQEKMIGKDPRQWLSLPLVKQYSAESDKSLLPDYSVNNESPAHEVWRADLKMGIYSAAAVEDNNVMIGDDQGVMHCFDLSNGNKRWTYRTGSRIASSAWAGRGRVVFGSTDGYVYCVHQAEGTLLWRYSTGAAVMGCPIVVNVNGREFVLVGGNGAFYSIDLRTGMLAWKTTIPGYCVSRPCVMGNKVFFGAWDCNMYALNLTDGTIVWKWNNGRSSDKYSPAAVWPVASNGRLFFVAPDRVFTCLDAEKGSVIYRTDRHMVRENIGISPDGKVVFSRCMRDSVQAMDATSSEPVTLWKTSADYGYDHDPSMMIYFPNPKGGGQLIFGTKNGLMHGVDAQTGRVIWRYKVGNCVINTVCPVQGFESSTPTVRAQMEKPLMGLFSRGKGQQEKPMADFIVTSSDGSVIRMSVPFE